MRRLLLSVTALSLCGIIIGCQTISGDSYEGDSCGCENGSCGGAEVVSDGAPVMPSAGPESIKEMPKVDDAPPAKEKLDIEPVPTKPKVDNEPAPLPPGPGGLEIK